MRLTKISMTSLALTISISALLFSGCDQPEKELQLVDLTSAEYTYVQRLVVLERAKAIALHDRDLGNTVLDSLSEAWGDSVEAETAALSPSDPIRSREVHDLLKRVVSAEKDSLMLSPTVLRLSAPLALPVETPLPLADSDPQDQE